MKKNYLRLFLWLLFISINISVKAQLTGTLNIPGAYASLALAITDLNAQGVGAGGVTLNLLAANPQTTPAGGYVIGNTGNILVGATNPTAANPVIIEGNSNTITAFAGQTSGLLNDAIFKLIGADYVTIQNFTMQENAANVNNVNGTNTMTEWGVALLRVTTTDGSQNNTIKNNAISLNRSYRNTFGVYSSVRHTPTAPTAATDITSVAGGNFGNKIYFNAISNVDYGIVFMGSVALAAYMDTGNDIGGNAAATGNTITNWGGNANALSSYVNLTASSYCIFSSHQINENVSYNTITSAAVTGAAFTFGGILKNYSTTQPAGTITTTFNNNTITLTSANASGPMFGINSQGISVALSTANITINNNTILNCVYTGAGSTALTGITNLSLPGILNMNNNVVRGNTSNTTSGDFTGISNSGAVVTTIDINNNQIGNAGGGAVAFSAATSGTITGISNTAAAATATVNITNNSMQGISCVSSGDLICINNGGATGVAINITDNQLGTTTGDLITYSAATANFIQGIFTNGGTTACVLTIQNNSIRGIVHTVAATSFHKYIASAAGVASANILNNTFINLNVNTTGNVTFIDDAGFMGATGTSSCSNNAIVTAFNKSGASGNVYVYTSGGNNVNGSTMTETGNNFSNITMSGTGTLLVWQNASGLSSANGPTRTITGNTFSNITGGSGQISIMILDVGGPTTCSSNIISNISGTGSITGISIGANDGQGTHNYSSNTITSLASSGTGGSVRAIYGGSASVPTLNISNSNITGLSSTGASSFIEGIRVIAGATVNVNDNTVNNLAASGATSPQVAGIVVSNTPTTVNLFKNKVTGLQVSSAITAGSPSVIGFKFIGGATVNAYNNFIAGLTAPATSYTDAVQGISVDNLLANTTYNVYYNSININAGSSGTDFGTSGIYHTGNATSTTGTLNVIDNIIVNTSTSNGSGRTVAHRRSGTLLNNYAATSDYNLFYAGTPSSTRLIYYDGSNSDQTLAAYQTRVSTREASSISLMPVFTSATDLHLTAVNCGIDGKGTPIAITTDIDAATRNITTPDIGADEFTASYSSTILAGVAATAVCDNRNLSPAPVITTYATNVCDLIAKVLPSGADPVAGRINVCVTLDASQLYFNGEPYVQRHYDLEPATSNQTTTSATITLYFNDAEFALYNSNNPVWPALPTIAGGGNADPNITNAKVTQYHGTPTGGLPTSTPGNYTGTRILITSLTVVLNGTIWSVTFNVTGFSGFYLHTNNFNAPLPITINYFNGIKQGSNHLLNWKVTCNSTPRATMTLERSGDSRNFSAINAITADAARCRQPFDYTDANPLKGLNYYRLKIVDADGKNAYSSIVALLNVVKGFDMVSIAPNPVTNGDFKLNIACTQSSKMELVIFDMQGRLVIRQTVSVIAGYNSVPINVANLSSGTYTIQATIADDKSRVMRFVKQ